MGEIIDQLLPVLIPALTGIVGFVWGKVNAIVQATPNKIDDAVLKVVQDAINSNPPQNPPA